MQNSEFRRPLRGRNKNAETINTGTQFEITSHEVGHNNSEFLIQNSEFNLNSAEQLLFHLAAVGSVFKRCLVGYLTGLVEVSEAGVERAHSIAGA